MLQQINSPQVDSIKENLAENNPAKPSLAEKEALKNEDLEKEKNPETKEREKEIEKMLHKFMDVEDKTKSNNDQNYIDAFINNKLVSNVVPDLMNWINIIGNTVSLGAHALGLSDGVKKVAKEIGSVSTKSFMIATSVINIVERCASKNYLSALGFLNDIFIASFVGQENTYLARGTASGTYNMGNSLADSVGRTNENKFKSIEDHISSTFKAYKKFFKNLFSKDIVKNFKNHKNSMWGIFGGIGSNIGALSWMLTGKTKIPTIIRDVCGVLMDIEQLNPGHLKSGRKHYFWSGVTLGIGTTADLLMRFVPEKLKDILVPTTFIFDGLGRHLLRLDRNELELEKQKVHNNMGIAA